MFVNIRIGFLLRPTPQVFVTLNRYFWKLETRRIKRLSLVMEMPSQGLLRCHWTRNCLELSANRFSLISGFSHSLLVSVFRGIFGALEMCECPVSPDSSFFQKHCLLEFFCIHRKMDPRIHDHVQTRGFPSTCYATSNLLIARRPLYLSPEPLKA